MNRRFVAILVCAVLAAGIGVAPALARDGMPLRFGVKAGINISDFRGNDVEGLGELLDWKTGFCGGVFASYAVNDWFSLQPELLYSMKGMKLGLFTESFLTFSLDYIEIPVLAVAKLPVQSKLKPFVYGGPVIGFNVRSEAGVTVFDEDFSADLSEYVATTEFSLAFGAGINIAIAGREMTLEGRYVPGLTNVFEEIVEDGQAAQLEWKNDTISILLGLAF